MNEVYDNDVYDTPKYWIWKVLGFQADNALVDYSPAFRLQLHVTYSGRLHFNTVDNKLCRSDAIVMPWYPEAKKRRYMDIEKRLNLSRVKLLIPNHKTTYIKSYIKW